MPGRIRIDDLFEEVLEEIPEAGSVEAIEFAYESFWRSVAEALREKRAVLILNVGRFELNRIMIVYRIIDAFARYRRGEYSIDTLRKKVTYHYKFYRAAINYKPGTGKMYKIKLHYAKTDEERKNIVAYPYEGPRKTYVHRMAKGRDDDASAGT